MEQSFKWNNYKWILAIAVLVRMIAVVFSQGYGMHDDHFLIVEASASWADGFDYNSWLPWTNGNNGPEGHTFSYVGLNYLYFAAMKVIGISDPKTLMLFNRFLHAAFSMIVVVYGIKITEKLSTIESAKKVGWFLAALWILPFLSVRNLVETTAIPFLILGVWYLLRNRNKRDFLWAGLIIGMAVSFRYQIGVFAIGVAAVYFFQAKWKPFLLFCAGTLATFIFTQGLIDYLIWGYPFAEIMAYVVYNLNEGTGYLPNQNYFMYFFVLIGTMLVPMGFVLFAGFIKSWKKYALIFVPTIIFILFHTVYPNRQERFVLSILPFFIILGVVGYDLWKDSERKRKLWKISWIAFWVINIPMLFFASTMYSKQSRVEAMYSLYDNKIDNERILLEGSASQRTSMLPRFYAGDWECSMVDRTDPSMPLTVTDNLEFDFIFFFDEEKLDERIVNYKTIYPNMTLVKKCEPSLLDKLLRSLNPHNANEYIEVWQTNVKPLN